MGLEVAWVAGLQQEEATVGAVATGFEGFEKRLEIEFSYGPSSDASGLRSVSRQGLDRMLKAAECTIVAKLSSDEFDSYVLSESSLFVYPLKVVIKTCGTTKLLRSIPVLLELASGLDLSVRCCKYRRGSFFFPAEQEYPHGSFTDEVEFLDGFFGGGRGYVLGSPSSAQNWHVYVAPAVEEDCGGGGGSSEPSFTLEMCMTELDRKVAAEFFKGVNCSAAGMTRATGIDGLLPGARICDFAFDPCGYSMNSVEGGAYSTIHVTPEDGFSYASFETMGYGPREIDLQVLVDRVVRCFKPGFFSLALYATGIGKKNSGSSWGVGFVPSGYSCVGSSRQELGSEGDVVVYHTFRAAEEERSSPSPSPLLDWSSSRVPKSLAVAINPKLQDLESLSEIEKIQALKLKQLVGRLVEQAA